MSNAIDKLRSSLAFSAGQGTNVAVMTTQEAVSGALFEIDQLDQLNRKYFTELETLRQRAVLFEWLKTNVGNIDFTVIVPPKVLCTNPWIAVGHNFESAIAQAKEQLHATIA